MVKSNISKESLDKLIDEVNPFYQRNEILRNLEQEPDYRNPTDFELYNKEENVIEANDYQLGNNLSNGTLFGFTDTYKKIIVLWDRLKGEARKTVLKHEEHHRENIADSEYMTRKRTNTEDFTPNPIVNPIGGYHG